MTKSNNEKGQIVVFMFVGFLFFVVLLAIIMNSSIITAQKIRMQQVLDLAMKQAAQVQVSNLKNIINDNISIGKLWDNLQFLEINNPLHPFYIMRGCGVYAQCPGHGRHNCPGNDKKGRAAIFSKYTFQRGDRLRNIKNRIEKTNEMAYEAALEVLLAPKNMPGDLKEVIRKNYGGSMPNAQKLKEIYETEKYDFSGKGKPETIKERYDLSDSIKKSSLFVHEERKRIVVYDKFAYRPCGADDKGNSYIPGLNFGKGDLNPTKRYYKIKKIDESYDPYFSSFLSYKPVYNFNFFKIFKRDQEDRLTKELLFNKELELKVFSMARPTGGDINNDREYKDAELTGVAEADKKVNLKLNKTFKAILH